MRIRRSDDVASANRRFYDAFQSLSIDEMEKVWSHSNEVICIHPGWDLIVGWEATKESWATIFANTEEMRIKLSHLRISSSGEVAWVVCLENIATGDRGMTSRYGFLATNIFRREGGGWLMVHHQGSPVSNYVPPPPDMIFG